ncbi:MAG: hypothetical protein NTX25_22505 [Proteobacteria bacterium]|nr:hypothetical protein [Pseudomonadota bacterium]
MDEVELREELPRKVEQKKAKESGKSVSPKKKKGRFNAKHGEGEVIVVRLNKEQAPHMMRLLSAKSPAELERDFGLVIPNDLPWPPPTQKKVFSWRVAVILETIGRKGRKGADSEQAVHE